MKQLLLNQRLMLVAGLVLSALASCTTFGAVTAFSEVFKSFGGDLPPVTRLILKFYPALLIMPAAVVLAWCLWPRREYRGLAALVTGVTFSIAMPLVLTLAMYWPVASFRQ